MSIAQGITFSQEAGFWVFENIEEQKLTRGTKKNAEVFHVLILRIVKKNCNIEIGFCGITLYTCKRYLIESKNYDSNL